MSMYQVSLNERKQARQRKKKTKEHQPASIAHLVSAFQIDYDAYHAGRAILTSTAVKEWGDMVL